MNKLRYILYVVAIILLNIVATTLFFRIDLTENRSYSLSDASKELVKNLEEPLTIKVFLSQNLPVPYNTLERDIRDILMEYKLKANKHFNYTIDLIDKENRGNISPETYNIYPVNIQNIEQDEVKVVSAYIGIAFIHGDLVDTIPAIQYNQNLELLLTNKIRTLTEKSTSLLGLEDNIKIKLYISPILYRLTDELAKYKDLVKELVSEMNSEYFNRLDYEFIEADENDITSTKDNYSVTTLNLEDENGEVTRAISSIIIKNGKESEVLDLINQDIFGRTVISNGDEIRDKIKSSINKMIGSSTKIGYLVSNGTIPMNQNQMMGFTGQQEPTINNLSSIITQDYAMAAVDLSKGVINSDIKTLIIARPTTKFSDRELFLLDQFLLKGNSILLAMDQLTMDMEKSNPNYGIEAYKEVDHGLLDLLKNYGIEVHNNMVMDQKSFKQVQRDASGSIIESQIYFAPLIQKENMNRDLPILDGVNELITFRMAQLSAVAPEKQGIETIFTTTNNGWLVDKESLSLNPSRIAPGSEKDKYSIALLKDGHFTSFFKDKPVPPKQTQEESENQDVNEIVGIEGKESVIPQSNSGKLVVLSSSDMVTDSILSKNYNSNIVFTQNILDYLSGREDYIEMRSKGVLNRPMVETTILKRNFIKYFNIVGLPILVAVAGLISYLLWLQKKKRIYHLFMEDNNEK